MTSTGGVPYLGSKISLISKSEIRYEGILYTIDTKDSTVALSKVRSFGTEDRPTDRPVAPRDEIYEYIIFRGTDIKDIRVCQPPKPHPTLEGGLPNDPAIVQHSASSTMSSNAAVGSQKQPAPIGSGGSSSYGPIGSTTFSQAAPGPPFPSGNVPAQPQNSSNVAPDLPSVSGSDSNLLMLDCPPSPPASRPRDEVYLRSDPSPVMDMLNHNSRPSSASPNLQSHGDSKSPNNLEGRPSQRGRGGNSSGFYRGGRGRGVNQGGNQGYRGRGGGRGGYQPGRPTANPKKEPLKFDAEYDFDKANDEFKELLESLQKSSIEAKTASSTNGEAVETPATELEEGEVEPETPEVEPEQFYDKKKSFFDSISCEATEKSKNAGSRQRNDRNAEFKLNKETFGVAGNRGGRGGYYNRRGYNNGGGYRGGYRGGNQGGGYRGGNQGGDQYRGGQGGGYGRGGYGRGGYNNQGSYNGFNGRFARDGNNGYRGGRGRGGYNNGERGQRAGGEGGRGNWRNQEN